MVRWYIYLNFSAYYCINFDITGNQVDVNYTDRIIIKSLSSFQEVSEEVEDQDYKSTRRLIAWQIFWGIFPVHFQILGRIYMDDCFLVKVSFYWNYFVIYFDLIQKRLQIFMFLFVELLNLEYFSYSFGTKYSRMDRVKFVEDSF